MPGRRAAERRVAGVQSAGTGPRRAQARTPGRVARRTRQPVTPAPSLLASLFGLSPTQALVVLFVVLPFAVAAVVIPFVAWRHSGDPKPVLTSEILAHGVP